MQVLLSVLFTKSVGQQSSWKHVRDHVREMGTLNALRLPSPFHYKT